MKILIVDDDPVSCQAVSRFLSVALGHDVTTVESAPAALESLAEEEFHLVVSDIRMPGMSGIELLRTLRDKPGTDQLAVVLMTGFADVETAIAAVHDGAFDYLRKPIEATLLSEVVQRVEESRAARNAALSTSKPEETSGTGESDRDVVVQIPDYGAIGFYTPEMRTVRRTAMTYAEDPGIPVLIEGETGTGKEGIARLVHHGAGRNSSPFVPVNCSAIAPGLFESELFGYEEGAFTGASRKGKEGMLELAQGGTLFLDEVGEMPLELQPKLLRVLQERELFRVGGKTTIKLNVRIIAATNQSLDTLVESGRFRRDLYYRLNLGRIHLAPLREIPGAILPLAHRFLHHFARDKKKLFQFIGAGAAERLTSHDWPGNIRELQNTIERIVLLYNDEVVRAEHLTHLIQSGVEDIHVQPDQELDPERLRLPEDEFNLRDFEQVIIERAYDKFKGNKSRTARYLGISRNTLLKRLQESGVE